MNASETNQNELVEWMLYRLSMSAVQGLSIEYATATHVGCR